MALRPYQTRLIEAVRGLLALHRCVMMQLATGGGKTRIFCEMVALAVAKKNSVWIVVPRNELLMQSSDQLSELKQSHGMISAKSKESRAYSVHVVSKDTLVRRIKAGKIKVWPKLVIIDEAHLAIDQQIFIRDNAPSSTKFIGVTATPEKLDGRGLKDCPALTILAPDAVNGMYNDITYGPTIKELVELGYLCDVRYFGIPGVTAEDFTSKDFSGTEIKQDVLDAILKKRQIYGNMIAHYKEHAHNKACIVFCRSVKAAEETAQRFREAGYKFESIDGKMTDNQRKVLINGLKTGRIHGLTSCELICYGLDVPKVECIIKLRFTMSKSLDSQMNGRGLRPYEGKEYCVILDPVGCLTEHGHPFEEYEWKFSGTEKRRKKKGVSPASLKLCTECFLHYEGTGSCPHCGSERGKKKEKQYQEIDGRLVEIKGPVKLNDRPEEDRREIQDQIGALIDEINENGIAPGPVGELLKIAEKIGRNPMWVYWRLSEGMQAVNEPLLAEIRRIKGHQPGWIFFQRKEITRRLGR